MLILGLGLKAKIRGLGLEAMDLGLVLMVLALLASLAQLKKSSLARLWLTNKYKASASVRMSAVTTSEVVGRPEDCSIF